MKSMTVSIHDKEGLHARPAGVLNKAAKSFESSVTITKEGKTADMKRIFALMGLGIKCGEQVTITCEGADEEAAIAKMAELMESL